MCFPWETGQLSKERASLASAAYEKLVRGVQAADELAVEEEKQPLFHRIQTMEPEEARAECLAVIFLVIRALRDVQQNVWAAVREDVDYYQKLGRLLDSRSLEIWMNNYLRWIMDYLSHASANRQADMMIRAKRFILDNYSNPGADAGKRGRVCGAE